MKLIRNINTKLKITKNWRIARKVRVILSYYFYLKNLKMKNLNE